MDHHPFRSARLLYRALESPRDDEFFHYLQADPFSQASSTPSILAPSSRKRTDRLREGFSDCLLGVMICLPTTPENLALAGSSIGPDVKTTKPSLVRDELHDYGIPIGCMSLDTRYPHLKFHRWAEVGIDIAPRYQRRGYGEEALNWLLDWGFGKANLHRIAIRAMGWNEGAQKLYKKIGFKLESQEREMWWFNDKWWDDIGLGMLEDEWRDLRAGKREEEKSVVVEKAS